MAFRTSFWGLGRKSLTMLETMQAIHELASPMAQRTFETYDRFDGIDDVICDAIEPACRAALGFRFVKVTGDDHIFILPDRYNDNALALSVDFNVPYRCVFDIMEDAGVHNRVRAAISESISRVVKSHYPVNSVYMQHRGHWNKTLHLVLTVVIEPAFDSQRIAA